MEATGPTIYIKWTLGSVLKSHYFPQYLVYLDMKVIAVRVLQRTYSHLQFLCSEMETKEEKKQVLVHTYIQLFSSPNIMA